MFFSDDGAHLPGDAADGEERRPDHDARRERARPSTSSRPQLVAAGKTDPICHGLARYPVFEGEATNRVIRLAEAAGVPVYIVHLSSTEALDEVAGARDRGAQAFAETCPQYLFLSLDDLGNGFEGAKFVCSPPLRAKDHTGTSCGRASSRTTSRSSSTDHCPFDFHGQKDLGRGDFRKVPNGLPGVEDRVDLLHDGGVVGGRITQGALGGDHLHGARPSCSACTRARAPSRSARTRTS